MRALLAGAVLSVAAVGCSSTSYPASPVAARLSDREAASLATNYLNQQNVPPRTLATIEPTETGTRLHYATAFDPTATPPEQVRIVDVNNNGTVREIWFNDRD